MMEPGFDLALHEALEQSLGFALKPLERLDGEINLNFRAVRATDGLAFAVKCSPPEKCAAFAALCGHLAALEGTKAARRLFPDALARFRNYDVLCLSWCDGVRLFPDRLTDSQMEALADDYLEFSTAMQSSTDLAPLDPVLDWRQKTLDQCTGVWGGVLRRMIERELPVEGVTYDPKRLKVIHGDFHHGNFLFVDHRVAGYFDFEEFRPGYPAEDLVRYVTVCSEHLHFHELYRLKRLLAAFRLLVRQAPYGKDEWHVAVNAMLLYRTEKYIRRGLGLLQVIRLNLRFRFYRAMSSIIDG